MRSGLQAPGAAGAVSNSAPSGGGSPPAKTKPKRVMDWAREQEQFAHLPKLPLLGMERGDEWVG